MRAGGRVAGDERALGDDHQAQPLQLGQDLEELARDAEVALGRLVRVGGGPDDDGFRVPHRA
jgi:hypothetical protein